MTSNAPIVAIAAPAILAMTLLSGTPGAQGRGGQAPAAQAASAQDAAPIDLTGYWVSVVSEDWRHRMGTSRKGDYESLPLNPEGRRVADSWDLAKDDAATLQCKAFGIGGIIRQPGRLHITWQDPNALTVEFDAGTQTRLLNFDRSRPAPPAKTWQGHSIAVWEGPGVGRRGGPQGPRGLLGTRGAPPPSSSILDGGSLKVTTTNFREGYLRKNGVPYSENAVITEYFHRLPQHPNGDHWLWVITVIEDPRYLAQPFYTSTHFKLEPNGAKWNPTPCRTAPPPPA